MAITVQDVLDQLMASVGKIPNTVDTLKYGDPNMGVKGIAISFMPTYHVIQQAVSMGANLLITHEGLFYSHTDNTETLKNDPVYQEKFRLIYESGIAIYRFHDYWHRYQPDGIMVGLVHALGWEPYVSEHQPAATILTVPSMTAREIAEYVKRRLDIPFVRVSGDLSTQCARIGLLAGYRGRGALSIPLFEKESLDLIIYGEGPEWETPEYVRDAVCQGKQKALIVLGHAESEEPGMKYLAEWLKTIFFNIPIYFIPEKPIFHVI
ncbi:MULTISPECIES: Nif3-like dinuclear metal center hexameric protein [Parageobacillus]|uniref:GTP cyclohydrolase 1 type 2 homolog n=1 Tax=Parageobacillus thermantarcticus TaxID=186116 RepID=A0A1I0SP76_9BACL|nr:MULTISPECIES: Nif3-like dinuclear metal center hexameric protein [Parageobacillus]AEH48178.1 NGG1p interacting factor 3 protein, NIF3 [Parageobacillus thermoglucosidasius C56-YS93]MBY6267613.1 transcriptional regulator [Parageobacillus thermoglucosidasius]OUM89780.1 MAG: transcriptional regulator [Parageobacillus thermoglucosidasius]SFA40586.1 Putative GTP cyclohydrolase 1 type 2, NIF3 family [Parageobacillus thermantarcticus]